MGQASRLTAQYAEGFVLRYISTRGQSPVATFEEVLLGSLAPDGGLFVPESWPTFSRKEIRALAGLGYSEIAFSVIQPYVGDAVDEDSLRAMIADTYASFRHAAVAPLRQLDARTWLLELFHGPTLAFKDFALQLLGRLFDHVLRARGHHITLISATSGDTGSAAIEACRDRALIDIFVLHPDGRISAVQRRQMTTVCAGNVYNLALSGTFDDCQDLVKSMFNDHSLRKQLTLTAANSINWARIMTQVAYYFHAAIALGAPDRKVAFSVPTGNFGNVYAGYAAARMGLPIVRLIVGSNSNDILTRFFETRIMQLGTVHATLSPSMDIQVSSNFERLLFELCDRDGEAVANAMAEFHECHRFTASGPGLELFAGHRVDDTGTLSQIARIYAETGGLVDPHTAVGIAAAQEKSVGKGIPVVALATAHPAKFPEAVERATGIRPALPPHLADLFEREEHMVRLANDLPTVKDFVRSHARAAHLRAALNQLNRAGGSP